MSKSTPTRTFYLEVADDLIPFTKDPKKGFKSFKTQDGLYFNTRARVPVSQTLQFEYANQIGLKIKELINAEARKLQSEWYRGIPNYFNRRAFGMYFRPEGYPKNKRPKKLRGGGKRFKRRPGDKPHRGAGPFIGPRDYLYKTRGKAIEKKYTNRKQFAGRTHTGQLRRALIITDLTVGGCMLLVRPCYASTGKGVDYVNILMKGSKGRTGHPYIPALDRRIKNPGARWRGIRQSYWLRWQAHFMAKVDSANARLHQRLSQMMVQMQILQAQDIRRAVAGSKKEKNLTAIEAEKKARKEKANKVVPDSKYNKTRDGKYWNEGAYKKDPQVYKNRHGDYFNPYNSTKTRYQ